MPVELVVAIIFGSATIFSGIMAFISAVWNRRNSSQLEMGETYEKMFLQLRSTNEEQAKEIEERDRANNNLTALLAKERKEHNDNLQREKNRRYELERERNAAIVCYERNQRLVRKMGGTPIEYDPPNGTDPSISVKP